MCLKATCILDIYPVWAEGTGAPSSPAASKPVKLYGRLKNAVVGQCSEWHDCFRAVCAQGQMHGMQTSCVLDICPLAHTAYKC